MKYFKIFQCFILVVINLTHIGNSARILFYFGFATYSHRILVWPLVEELVRLGHDVTFFSSSPNRQPNSNVTDFVPKAVTEFYKGDGVMNINLLHVRLENRIVEIWNTVPKFGEVLCEIILKSPDTKEWVNNSTFDLIFIDSLFNDCAFAFVHKFKAKHILFGTNTIFSWNYEPNGIFPETSWIPDFIHHFPTEPMTFTHRLISTIENLRWHFVRQYSYLPHIEEIIRNELGLIDLPPISEMEKNVSLFFINTHFSEEYARALPPFVIPIGGIQIQHSVKDSVIPETLKTFIESGGSNGFIFISFGSDTPISTLPLEKLTNILNALKNTKLPCIWKWDGQLPKNVPKNVVLVKWAPQQALLSDPRIKMMIMHAGLLSIHEAIHHQVPLIAIPIFAEQAFNAERISRKGFGIQLDIVDMTEADLTSAITSILNIPSYKERVREVAHAFKDRINTPLETAVWYTEYVLRHKDTRFMKPYTMHQTWYERKLLDVWCLLFVLTLVIGISLGYLLKIIVLFTYKLVKKSFTNSNEGKLKSG